MPNYLLANVQGNQRFELPSGRSLVLGRAITSDIAVIDPTISRRHAELEVVEDGVRVRDLGSSNGTFINGARAEDGTLRPNDSVSFGKVVFQLKKVEPTRSPRQPPPSPPGGTIVREIAVTGTGSSVLTSLSPGGTTAMGQLRVEGEGEDQRQARKLSMLLEISQALSGEFDLDRILATVADMTFEVMNVDRVNIMLREEPGELFPKIARSRLGEALFQQVPRSIAHKVVDERVGIITDNAATDDRFTGHSIMLQSVRSAMCVPLMSSADEVLGVLYVDSMTAINSFSDEDLKFLIAFGGLAAVAIRNSRYAEQIQRQVLVRSNFERYFAPNVAAEIARLQGEVRRGGDKRPITVLFSDIRGFTAMSERMTPDAIAELLSDYFTEMVDVIFEHGGTLDKFMGDAILALWGAPLAHEDDADRAMRAAIEMQEALRALNTGWAKRGSPPIGVGIGINYGEVFAGNIGSHRRLEYTVIGDAVNVASRLCSQAGAGEILLSESFYGQLREKPGVESLPPLALKGKAKEVKVLRLNGER